MSFEFSDRLNNLPPYLFADLDVKKAILKSRGVDLINISIGDPDQPTPAPIVAAMAKAIEDQANHQYPSYVGDPTFRAASCAWMKELYNLQFDHNSECIALIGSKEGIAHLPLAFVNPGDVVLVPDPGYPVYSSATNFVGGEVYKMPLRESNDFIPDLSAIPESIAKRAKIMFLNYPNNPTAAVATKEFFKEAITFALKYNILIAHDAAYSEIFFDNERPLSMLEVDGARECVLEFHSLSKTFNMTGWRLGFAVGCAKGVAGLGKAKTNIDSGAFTAIQQAGIAALQSGNKLCGEIRQRYQARRDYLVSSLQKVGWQVRSPKATFYVWSKVPTSESSTDFVSRIMDEAGVILTPGLGFGSEGDKYVRFSLTVNEARLEEAVTRIAKCL